MQRMTDEEILKHRASEYGDAKTSFGRIAEFWNIYLLGKPDIEPHDVANMMILLKISRSLTAKEHLHDTYAYIRNYATLAESLHVKKIDDNYSEYTPK